MISVCRVSIGFSVRPPIPIKGLIERGFGKTALSVSMERNILCHFASSCSVGSGHGDGLLSYDRAVIYELAERALVTTVAVIVHFMNSNTNCTTVFGILV